MQRNSITNTMFNDKNQCSMKKFHVILNGQFVASYQRLSYANKKVGEIVSQSWFSHENDLVEIYNDESGETIYTNENV